MYSQAYARWREFVGDPEDLLQRFERALDDGDTDPHALARAAIVSLSAAWETYVEELAREASGWRLRAGLLASRQSVAVNRDCDRLNNPTVEKAGHLLLSALGSDPWVNVRTDSMREATTRRFINRHQTTRHRIAHGVDRFEVSRERLSRRIAEFDEVVRSIDARARQVLLSAGLHPW